MDLYKILLQSWIPDKRFALSGMTVLEIQRTNQAGAYFCPKGEKTVIPANAGIHNARDSSKNGWTHCCPTYSLSLRERVGERGSN